MWLNDLKHLCIYKNRYVNILTLNTAEELNDLEEIQEPKVALNHTECEILLEVKALDINNLKVQGSIKDNNLKVEYFKLNVKAFINLKVLSFFQMAITDEDMQVIGQNCPQLKSLHLIKCFCEHFKDLVPGVNLQVDNICNIKQLQELEIPTARPPGSLRELKLECVQQILNNLIKLKSLNLEKFTIVCEDHEKFNRFYMPFNSWPLETLNMGSITFDFWCTFTGYLKCFPQLRDLTINIGGDKNVVVNIKLVDILNKYCKNIQVLRLENCVINIENLCPLQGLKELTLKSCHGLTFSNFQQILGGLKLRVFNLVNTGVFDIHNYIYVSDTLESVTIDTIHFTEISQMFQRSLNNFTNLQTLKWYNGDINHNWIRDKCPQLQQLHVTNPYHLYSTVSNMKTLKELTFTSCIGLSWSLLRALLFNLSLKRLNIYASYAIIEDVSNLQQKSFKLRTTLDFITISYEIFLMGLKYWLELLEANEKLRVLIYGKAEDILNARLLCLLLAVECVRQRWKYIKICGFGLELENFQHNTILKAFVQLHINTNHYKARNMPFTLEL